MYTHGGEGKFYRLAEAPAASFAAPIKGVPKCTYISTEVCHGIGHAHAAGARPLTLERET